MQCLVFLITILFSLQAISLISHADYNHSARKKTVKIYNLTKDKNGKVEDATTGLGFVFKRYNSDTELQFVMTAAHIVNGPNEDNLLIVDSLNREIPGKKIDIIHLDFKRDIAVLLVLDSRTNIFPDHFNLSNAKSIEFFNEKFVSAFRPSIEDFNSNELEIKNGLYSHLKFKNSVFEIKNDIFEMNGARSGMSGGPVFHEKTGSLVGMMQSFVNLTNVNDLDLSDKPLAASVSIKDIVESLKESYIFRRFFYKTINTMEYTKSNFNLNDKNHSNSICIIDYDLFYEEIDSEEDDDFDMFAGVNN